MAEVQDGEVLGGEIGGLTVLCQLAPRVLLLCESPPERSVCVATAGDVLERVTLVIAGGSAADVVWSSEEAPPTFHWHKTITGRTANEAERRRAASEAIRDYARYLRHGGTPLGGDALPPHLAAAASAARGGGHAGVQICVFKVVATDRQGLLAAAGARTDKATGGGRANNAAAATPAAPADAKCASVVISSFQTMLSSWQEIVTLTLPRATQPTGVLGRLLMHASRVTTATEEGVEEIDLLREEAARIHKTAMDVNKSLAKERMSLLQKICRVLNERKRTIAELRNRGRPGCSDDDDDSGGSGGDSPCRRLLDSGGSSDDDGGGGSRGSGQGRVGLGSKRARSGSGGGDGAANGIGHMMNSNGHAMNGNGHSQAKASHGGAGKGKGRAGGTQGSGAAALSSTAAPEPFLSQVGTKEGTVEDLIAGRLEDKDAGASQAVGGRRVGGGGGGGGSRSEIAESGRVHWDAASSQASAALVGCATICRGTSASQASQAAFERAGSATAAAEPSAVAAATASADAAAVPAPVAAGAGAPAALETQTKKTKKKRGSTVFDFSTDSE